MIIMRNLIPSYPEYSTNIISFHGISNKKQWVFPLKMVIFHSYVKLPEGKPIHWPMGSSSFPCSQPWSRCQKTWSVASSCASRAEAEARSAMARPRGFHGMNTGKSMGFISNHTGAIMGYHGIWIQYEWNTYNNIIWYVLCFTILYYIILYYIILYYSRNITGFNGTKQGIYQGICGDL